MKCDSVESIEKKPLVSVVIPVYNGANYMREAIDSALAQTYENIEVIVVNDGSNDGGKTALVAQSYGNRIRYFEKENGGVSSALNLGIRNMHGEYFSWLSHDDVYFEDKIKLEIDALKELRPEEQNCIVSCRSIYIDNQSQIMKKTPPYNLPPNALLAWDKVLHILLSCGTFNGCALLIPKTVFAEVGLFDESMRFNQDGFMWNKIFLKGYSLLTVDRVGVKNRIHGEQFTQKGQDVFHRDCRMMSHFLIPELESKTTKDDRFIFEYAKYNAKYGNRTVVKNIRRTVDREKLTCSERLKTGFAELYGILRPCLRKAYYKVRLKTLN